MCHWHPTTKGRGEVDAARLLRRVAVVVAVMLTVPVSRAVAQISPGPLARSHAALNGSRNCLACHGTRKDAMDASCLDCHKEIAFLRAERRGLHGRGNQPKCASCHPDHAGAEFNLTAWTADSARRFDHRRAGWTLDGQHREASCDDCHAAALQVGLAARLAPTGATKPQWTGLETTCANCHEDVHQQSLGLTCSECHDSEGWAPAPKFDHADTDYPLTGKHQQVDCQQCHTAKRSAPEPRHSLLAPMFSPVASAQCSSCHQDPHGGRLGATCSDCHTTTGFAERKPGGFNHARTRYALEGKHVQVACAACHGPTGRRTNPGFATCAECHTDSHQGTATLAGKPVDCATCHDVRGFAPAILTVARHAESRYPLEGRHAEVACASCHRPQKDGALERPGFDACTSCHVDPHGSQLSRLDGTPTCEDCHVLAGWNRSSFSAAQHADAGLPLEGRHAEIDCAACHGAASPAVQPIRADTIGVGAAGIRFQLASATCASCHADPHVTDSNWVQLPECSACHSATSFRPATVSVETHGSLGYPLAGAHRAVPCIECHASLSAPATAGAALRHADPPPPLDLRIARQECASCHDSPHGDQFDSRGTAGCAACHSEEAFQPADRFDHQRDAAFSLEGAHAEVACAQCHVAEPVPGGGTRTRFKPVATTCEGCHTRRAA